MLSYSKSYEIWNVDPIHNWNHKAIQRAQNKPSEDDFLPDDGGHIFHAVFDDRPPTILREHRVH